MKLTKTISLLVISLMLISLMPLSFAEDTSEDTIGKNRQGTENAVGGNDRFAKKANQNIRIVANAADTNDTKAQNAQRLKENAQKLRERLKVLSDEKQAFLEELSVEEQDKLKALTRAQFNIISKLDKEKLQKRLTEFKVKTTKIKDLLKKRDITKERLDDIKEKLKIAKERYKENKEKAQERRQEFVEKRDEYRACIEEKGEDSDECQAIEDEIIATNKEYLLNTADALINHLEQVKEKLKSNDNVDEIDVTEAVGKIDELITKINTIKQEIEEVSTKSEFADVAAKLKRITAEIKDQSMMNIGRLLNADVGRILARSSILEQKLEDLLARLQEQEIVISDLDTKLTSFSGYVDEAKDLWEQAEDRFQEAKDLRNNQGQSSEVTALVKESRELAKTANSRLKDAHNILVDIIKEAKAKNLSIDELQIDEEEDIEVIEEEDEEEETDDSDEAGDENNQTEENNDDYNNETVDDTGAIE